MLLEIMLIIYSVAVDKTLSEDYSSIVSARGESDPVF